MSSSTPQKSSIRLWNSHITPQTYGSTQDVYFNHALEQYKIYVETAEQVTARRGLANTFFITLQTLLITITGVAVDAGWNPNPRWLVLFPLIGVLLLCWVWWRLVKSYRQLNSAKFKVIEEFERLLPTAPFVEAEWRGALADGKDRSLYAPFTEIERVVPVIFAVLYITAAVLFILFG